MKRISPQKQLWRLLNERQKQKFAKSFYILRNQCQEDICLALIAYIKYGIEPNFSNPLQAAIFDLLAIDIDLQNIMDLEKLQKERIITTI